MWSKRSNYEITITSWPSIEAVTIISSAFARFLAGLINEHLGQACASSLEMLDVVALSVKAVIVGILNGSFW